MYDGGFLLLSIQWYMSLVLKMAFPYHLLTFTIPFYSLQLLPGSALLHVHIRKNTFFTDNDTSNIE